MSERDKPLVSILIPVYNRVGLLAQAVESALAQNWPAIEVVVVDNCSDDGTWELCQDLAARDPRVRVFRNDENLGPVRNWAACMERARGEYGKLLFSDDLIAPDFVAATMQWIQDPRVGFVFTRTTIGADPATAVDQFYHGLGETGVYPAERFLRHSILALGEMPVSPGCALFRLADLRRHLITEPFSPQVPGAMDHGAGADLLLYLRTAADYPLIAYVDEALTFFRAHPGSISVADHQGEHVLPARYIQTQLHFYEHEWRPRRTGNGSRNPGLDAEIALRVAANHVQEGEPARARQALTEALDLVRHDPDAAQALEALQMPDGRTVAQHLEAPQAPVPASGHAPGPAPEAGLEELRARLEAGDLEAAFQGVSALLQRQPDTPGLIALYGEVLVAMGHSGDALAAMEEGLRLAPGDALLHGNLGALYWARGDLAAAAKSLQRALELAPDDPHCALNYARLLQARGEGEAALRHLDAWCERQCRPATASAPDGGSDHPLPATAGRAPSPGPDAEASDAPGGAREVAPAGVGDLLRAGEEAFEGGDLETARERFEAAHALDADDVEVLNDLMVLHWREGDPARALELLRQALERDPGDRAVLLNGSAVLAGIGQVEAAVDLLEARVRRAPGDAEARARLEALAGSRQEEGDATAGTGCGREEAEDVLVTAIVSTWNSERYLRGCLEDLEAQTIADRIEIIVVDSGSEQNEGDIVREFRQRHGNIRYLRTEERETVYAAWNRAIREARGRYLTNANTDDRHRPDAFERMVEVLEARPEVALVYADCAVTRRPNARFGEVEPEGYFRWPEFEPRTLFSVCCVGPQPMWRRALHDRYGEFDGALRVAGDYDFWLRLAPRETFVHLPEVLGLYLLAPDSVEHANGELAARETEQVRRRNWPAAWGELPAAGGSFLEPAREAQARIELVERERPLVSVIMPTRDRHHLLGRALDSVLAQHYPHWELVLVNDGGASVRALVEGRDPRDRIRLFELPARVGQVAARNHAMKRARGEILCYLDDDDRFLADHLSVVVAGLLTGGEDFVYTDVVLVAEDSRGRELQRHNPYAHAGFSRERLLVGNFIPINTWAHRRECLDEVGLMDETLQSYEDWEFLLRMSARYGFRHLGRTTAEVHHRVDRADNVTRRTLADVTRTYRIIYERHDGPLPAAVRRARAETLSALTANLGRAASGG